MLCLLCFFGKSQRLYHRIEDKDLPAHLRKNSRRNRKKARGITGKMESYRIRELRESLSGSGADLNQAKYLV